MSLMKGIDQKGRFVFQKKGSVWKKASLTRIRQTEFFKWKLWKDKWYQRSDKEELFLKSIYIYIFLYKANTGTSWKELLYIKKRGQLLKRQNDVYSILKTKGCIKRQYLLKGSWTSLRRRKTLINTEESYQTGSRRKERSIKNFIEKDWYC